MDTSRAINQTVPETDTLTCRQKPNDARKRTSPLNGLRGGRPRGSGVKTVDWRVYMCLGLDGSPDTTIAKALGISVRTFKRRKAERQRQGDSLWRDD
jgi:DNA invertase Pin-like site-specific DNA recombinase